MKLKIIFFFGFFLIISNTYANSFFDGLVGCYQSLEWNGKPVSDTGPVFMQSTIEKSVSFATLNMDGSRMPAYAMTLQQEVVEVGQNTEIVYGIGFPFINLGSYSEAEGTHFYQFKGQVRYRFQSELVGTLSHNVIARKLENDLLDIRIVTHVEETTAFNSDDRYLLKVVPCLK